MEKPNNFDAVEAMINTMKKSPYHCTFAKIHKSTDLPDYVTEKEFKTDEDAINFAIENAIEKIILRVFKDKVHLCYRE